VTVSLSLMIMISHGVGDDSVMIMMVARAGHWHPGRDCTRLGASSQSSQCRVPAAAGLTRRASDRDRRRNTDLNYQLEHEAFKFTLSIRFKKMKPQRLPSHGHGERVPGRRPGRSESGCAGAQAILFSS
jgi:hypothetical protein